MKQRLIKTGYGFLVLSFWLAGMYYVVFYESNVRDNGAEKPTGNYIIPNSNHGDIIYITEEQDFYVKLYGMTMVISFPCLVILGFVLHFAYGIKIFRGIKTDTIKKTES